MVNGRKYEYVLESVEIKEFYRKTMLEQARYRKRVWLILGSILAVEAILIPKGILLIVLMLAVIYLVAGILSYRVIKEQVEGQNWVLWTEAGRLKASRNGNYSEVPCGDIQLIRITSRLLMLGYMRTPQRPAWFVMPLRVFLDEGERDAFLDQIRNPQMSCAEAMPDGAGIEAEQAYLCLVWGMDAEKWVCLHKGAAALIQSGTFGKRERILGMLFWGVLTAVILTACVGFAACGLNWMMVVFSLSITALMLLRLFFRDPEKSLRRQVQMPVMARRACGFWRLSFSEAGVSVDMPGNMRDFHAWESLAYQVETKEAFYLFHRDKKHYIIVAKESFQNWDQVSTFQMLCTAHGIRTLPARQMHYMPDCLWFLSLVLYLIICLSVFVFSIYWNILRETGPIKPSYESRAWNPEDYPDYVPLDRQAEVLESLGLSVPEEWVESMRAYMEEYDLQEQVEGDPYTALLIDMGAPAYDEEGKGAEYSDEVFWFDFEGYDISTDYIDVLNGMLALAEGSSLDDVTDIEEDLTDADWEQGKGIVKVSLNWNGVPYQWDMEMYYDWIDGRVLGALNFLLKQEGNSQKFFYATGDNGQGAIVFFCTPEWAQEFIEATGLELERGFEAADR